MSRYLFSAFPKLMRRSPFKPGDPSAVQFTKEPLERLSSVFYGSEWDGKSSILGLCIPGHSGEYGDERHLGT